jgi:hypothetical protein
MTTLLTTMRQRLADAESDAERLRAAIQILEQAETSPSLPRRAARRTRPAAASAQPHPARRGRRSTTTEPEPTTATPRPAPAAGTPAPSKRRAAVAKRKPATAVLALQRLLAVVGENPGLTTTALARQTGGDQSALLELLKDSEQQGEVRREGERRATSWYRITDEDRVAARATQIAAQAKSAKRKGIDEAAQTKGRAGRTI